jgi:hypothetical protein
MNADINKTVLLNITNGKIAMIMFFLLVMFLFISSPIVLFLSLSIVFFLIKPKLSSWILIFSLFMLFVTINSNKELVSDYAWYYAHYKYWTTGDFTYLFENTLDGVVARYTEPLYHILSFLLAKIFGGKLAYDIFFTCLIYSLPLYALFIIKCVFNITDRLFYCLIFILMLVCINPVMVLHLIRQNIAGGFLLLSIAFHLNNKLKMTFLFSILSIATHSSMVIPVFFIHGFLCNSNYISLRYLLPFWTVLVFILGSILPSYITSNDIYDVLRKSDGTISNVVFLYDITLFLFAFFLSFFSKNKQVNKLLHICIIYYTFTISTYKSDLLILRFYHLYDYIRILNYVMIFLVLKNVRTKLNLSFVFGFSFCAFGFFYSYLRFSLSDFDFGGGFFHYLFLSFIDIG